MRNRTLTYTNLVFVGAALTLILLSYLSYERITRQVRTSNEVSKTQLLKFKLNDAFSHILKTETATRGFILSNDSVFYYNSVSSQAPINSILSEIKTLVTNNEIQNKNLIIATKLFQTRLAYLKNMMEIYKSVSPEQMDNLLLHGTQITNELDQRIDQMIATEDDLLAQRLELKQREERQTAVIIFLFSVLSIGILIFGFFKVKYEFFNNNLLKHLVTERTEEINRANEMLNKKNVELKRKNEELRSFTFVANHDLKEPLRKIELFVSRIKSSGDISPENMDLFAKVTDCVHQMNALLEGVFIYTLTDKPAEYQTTDLNKVAEASIKNLQEVINEKHAIVEFDPLPVIKAIPRHIEQVFTNLISNSLKYSRKEVKPHIKIHAEQEKSRNGSFIKITFSDNGIGFNEAYKDKIFEMFQRLHAKNEYNGTGIGLALCKKVVENHHGTIRATSKNGEGAEFTIMLPNTSHPIFERSSN